MLYLLSAAVTIGVIFGLGVAVKELQQHGIGRVANVTRRMAAGTAGWNWGSVVKWFAGLLVASPFIAMLLACWVGILWPVATGSLRAAGVLPKIQEENNTPINETPEEAEVPQRKYSNAAIISELKRSVNLPWTESIALNSITTLDQHATRVPWFNGTFVKSIRTGKVRQPNHRITPCIPGYSSRRKDSPIATPGDFLLLDNIDGVALGGWVPLAWTLKQTQPEGPASITITDVDEEGASNAILKTEVVLKKGGELLMWGEFPTRVMYAEGIIGVGKTDLVVGVAHLDQEGNFLRWTTPRYPVTVTISAMKVVGGDRFKSTLISTNEMVVPELEIPLPANPPKEEETYVLGVHLPRETSEQALVAVNVRLPPE